MVHPEVHAYLSEIGSIGGRTMTEKKRLALAQNARKPRPGRKKKADKPQDTDWQRNKIEDNC